MLKNKNQVAYLIIVAILLACILSIAVNDSQDDNTVATQGISSDRYYSFYTSNYTVYEKLKSLFSRYSNVRIVYTGKAVNPTPAPAPDPKPQPKPQPTPQPTPVPGLTAEEQQMVNLVNEERTKRGLNHLQVDMRLVKVARMKSQDMVDNNYFAHQSPTYGSPFDMMKSQGILYSYAGENIAGAPSVERAHTALMNSAGHKANILKPEFTHIGIGIIRGGPYGMMFSQEFIKK